MEHGFKTLERFKYSSRMLPVALQLMREGGSVMLTRTKEIFEERRQTSHTPPDDPDTVHADR